jgi:hypothetical protein
MDLRASPASDRAKMLGSLTARGQIESEVTRHD